MVQKVQIIRTEEDIEEVAIQVRDDVPTDYNDKRIYIDKSDGHLFVPKNGQYVKANIGVYVDDPTDALFWINDTEGKFKWKVNGVVNEMDVTVHNNTAAITSIEEFEKILAKLESGEVTDITVPNNAIAETFNEINGEKENISIRNSGIVTVDESKVGKFKVTKKTSGVKNYVEGIINYQSTSLCPSNIVDNGDGTSTIEFEGDMTKYISITQKFLVHETVRKTITEEIEFRKTYKEQREIEREQSSFYLLNDDAEPALITNTSLSYDINTNVTTIVVNNNGLDLTMGLSDLSTLRFVPFNLDVKGGSVRDSLLLDDLKLVEAYSETQEDATVLGADATLKYIKNSLAINDSGHIDYIAVNHSPNKKYWLMWGYVGTKSLVINRVVYWYSNDGLRTIHEVDMKYLAGGNTGIWEIQDFGGRGYGMVAINERNTHVSDAGEFVFVHQFAPSGDNMHPLFIMGSIAGKEGIFVRNGKTPWSQQSMLAFESSGTSYHYYCHTSAMDFETGIFMASANRSTDDLYFQAWALDFEKMEAHVITHTNVLTDYAHYRYVGGSFWADYEGERCFFCFQRHTNRYWHAFYIPARTLLQYADGDYTSDRPSLSNAFNTTIVADGTHNKSRILDEDATDFMLHGYTYEDGTLMVWGCRWDGSNPRHLLSVIDFSKTDPEPMIDTITFDNVPDAGEAQLQFGVASQSYQPPVVTINKDTTAQDIQDVLDNSHQTNNYLHTKRIDTETNGNMAGTPIYGRHIWGKWKRNNFETRVATVNKMYPVVEGIKLRNSDAKVLNYSYTALGDGTGLSGSFYIRGEGDGNNLISDGTFDNGLNDWIVGGNAVDDNATAKLYVDGAVGNGIISQTLPLPIKQHRLSIDVTVLSVDATVEVNIKDSYGNVIVSSATSFVKTLEVDFTPLDSSTTIEITVSGVNDGDSANVDNVSVEALTVEDVYYQGYFDAVNGGAYVEINGHRYYPIGFTGVAGTNGATTRSVNYANITEHLFLDGVTPNIYNVKGVSGDTASLYGFIIGHKDTKEVGFEFEVFTKAGIDHAVDFEIYSSDGTLKHTIVAGDSGSSADTTQNIVIGANYLDMGDYIICRSKADTYDVSEAYVRRVENNFIAYGMKKWFVSGDYANGFVVKSYGEDAVSIVSNTLETSGTAVNISISHQSSARRSVINNAVLNAKYDDNYGCGVWRFADRVLSQMDYNSSVLSFQSNNIFHPYNIFKKGNSIVMSTIGRHYNNGTSYYDNVPMLYKIPDYKEFVGNTVSSYGIGTSDRLYLTDASGNDHATDNRYGTRFAQSFVVPSNAGAPYSDLMLPVRTLAIPMSIDTQHTNNQAWKYFEDDIYVRCKLVRMTAGYPDDTQEIAVSNTKIPLSEIGSYNEYREQYFLFDNVKLTPSAEVCIIVWIEGLDIEAVSNNFAPLLRCNNAASTLGGKLFREFQNVWSEQTYSMWFTIFDYYMMDIRFAHEGGWNKNAIAMHPQTDRWRDITDVTIYPTSDGKYTGTYRVTAFYKTNEDAYSPVHAGSKSYSYSIDLGDTFDIPVISKADIIEKNGNPDYDENIVMAIVPKDHKTIELNETGSEFSTFSSMVNQYGDKDYKYNRTLTIGCGNHDYSSWINQLRLFDFTPGHETIKKLDHFRYGYGFGHWGTQRRAYYGSREFCPFHREFIFEIEFETGIRTDQRMLFDSYYLFRITLDPRVAGQKQKYSLFVYSGWSGLNGHTWTEEEVVDGYQRLRIIRSHADGIKMYRNLTKDDETAWVELTENSNNVIKWSDYSHATQIGRNDETRNWFSIGGYTENNDYNFYGTIGYIKYAIGTTSFVSDKIVHQYPIMFHNNKGEKIFSQRVYYDMASYTNHTKADLVYCTPKHLVDARREAFIQILKYKNFLTSEDRENTVEIEMTKKSEDDPTAIKGIYFDFDRR